MNTVITECLEMTTIGAYLPVGGMRERIGVRDGYIYSALFQMDGIQQGPTIYVEFCSVLCGSHDRRGIVVVVGGMDIYMYICMTGVPFAVH